MDTIIEKPQQVDIINIDQYNVHDIFVKHQPWGQSIDPHKLVLGNVIGSGTDTVVHKGSYRRQTVAVKFFDFGDIEITNYSMEFLKTCFMREVRLWEKLDHPNITKMIGATMSINTNTGLMKKKSETTSNFCVVSEYLKGGSLRAYIEKNRFKPKPCMKIVIRMALDIARGLSYLHSKKIIHLDVKPDNVLIDKKQTIKLADFGESVFAEQHIFTMSDAIGTLGYMAPEVFYRKEYGLKCEVFSFGIVLWEIYCCDFAYKTNLEKIWKSSYKFMRPRIPADCPRSLARLMEQCWANEPSERPAMAHVVDKLEEIAKSEGWKDKEGVASCFGFFKHGK